MAAIELQEPKIKKPRDRKVVRKVLDDIQRRNPERLLTPRDTVDAAKSPTSPLHSYFTWDNTVAGDEYRLAQARALIRSIKVNRPSDRGTDVYPKYVSLRVDRFKPRGGYRKTQEVISSKKLLEDLEETMKKDLDGFLRRYEVLKDLCQKVRRAAGIIRARNG